MPKAKSGSTTSKSESETKPKPAPEKADLSAKAASILTQGQALEKLGKTQAALGYYKRIARDYPGTPAAKTAAARIKALGRK